MTHAHYLRARITMASIALVITMVPCLVFAAEETAPKAESLRIPQALAAAGFTKFSAVMEASGLAKALDDDGPFTCFAPTDEALNSMPAEELELMTKDPKSQTTLRWLEYHLIPGLALKTEDLMTRRLVKTMDEKQFVTIWVSPGKIEVDRTGLIVKPNIPAANGVIHGIAGAIRPRKLD